MDLHNGGQLSVRNFIWLPLYLIYSHRDYILVHGGVSEWEPWFLCDATCGTSTRSRIRFCNNPVPAYRGRHCVEGLEEKENCTFPPCKRM